ncbi:hypothetical protein EIP86_008539 [Pleurotus ostreatoroseus]|nr:hypothetical protein EIP86_008539 [Pleurotus ostreatoroseus]
MSSPIAIPRRATSPARSEASDASSSLSSTNGLYVPLHKRSASAASSAPSSSPVASASWRNHIPANPKAAFNSTSRKAHGHKKSQSGSNNDASKRAPIPAPAHIPTPTTTHIALPFVYPISALLALSDAPAPLSSAQVERVRAVIPMPAEKDSKDKVAARRRRVGRPRKNSVLTQKATTKAPADVESRRARHADPVSHVRVHTAHGSWGWNANTAAEHQHDLEASWRHAPIATAVVA